jgi:hypothetical protein
MRIVAPMHDAGIPLDFPRRATLTLISGRRSKGPAYPAQVGAISLRPLPPSFQPEADRRQPTPPWWFRDLLNREWCVMQDRHLTRVDQQ